MTRMLILAGALMASASAAASGPSQAQSQAPAGAVVINPAWISMPHPEFPRVAHDNYTATGFVRLQCTARADGLVDACEVVEETPAGQGFAEEGLKAMALAHMRPRTIDGRPVETRVGLSFQFRLEDAAPASREVETAAEAANNPDPPSP
jgi:protein TonB